MNPESTRVRPIQSDPNSLQKSLVASLDRVSKLEGELQKYRAYKETATQRLQALQADKDSLTQDRDQSRAAAVRFQNIAANLMAKVNQTQQELEREKQRVSEAFENMRSEWTKVVSYDVKMRGILKDVQQKNHQMAEDGVLREARLRQLEADRDVWRQRSGELEANISEFKREIQELVKSREQGAVARQELQRRLSGSEEKRTKLAAELNRVQENALEQERVKRTLESQLIEAGKSVSESANEVARLTRQISQQTRRIEELEQGMRESQLRSDEQLEKKNATLETLNRQFSGVREANEQELHKIREQLETANAQLRNELAQARQEVANHEDVKASMWRELVHFEEASKEFKAQAEENNRKCSQASADFANYKEVSLREIVNLQRKLSDEQQGVGELRAEHVRVKETLEAELARLQDEMRGARARFLEQEQAEHLLRDMLLRAQRDLEHSQSETVRLAAEVATLREQKENLQRERAEKESENSRLQAVVEHERELRDRDEAKVSALEVALQDLNARLQQLEDVKDRLAEKFQVAESLREEGNREIFRLQSELASARQATAENEKNRTLLQAELTRVRQALGQAEQSVAWLEEERQKSEQLYVRLTQERADIVKRADDAYGEVSSLKLQMAENREKAQKELLDRVSELQSQLSGTRHEIARKNEEVERISGELASVTQTLAQGERNQGALNEELVLARQALRDAEVKIEVGKKDLQKWEELYNSNRAERQDLQIKLEMNRGELQSVREVLCKTEERLKSVETERSHFSNQANRAECALSKIEAEYQAVRDELVEFRNENSLLVAEVKRQSEELRKAAEDADASEVARKALWEELVAMERAKGERAREAEQIRGELNASKTRVDQLSAERTGLAQEVEACAKRIAGLEEGLRSSGDYVSSLEKELATWRMAADEDRKTIEALSDEVARSYETLKQSQQDWRGVEQSLQQQLRVAQAASEEARQGIDRLSRQLACSERSRRALELDYEGVGERFVELQVESQRLRQSIEVTETINRDLKHAQDQFAKLQLEKQLELDRSKRDVEHLARKLERSEAERLEFVRKEAMARFEVERLRKINQLIDPALPARSSEAPGHEVPGDITGEIHGQIHGSA